MTQEEMMQALAAPFSASDVEWRVQNTTKDHTRGMAVPYIDSRAIQNRLDLVVGVFNWKTEYRPWHQVEKGEKANASQLCGLSIYCAERQEWIQKRAAVLWNVGRYLYDLAPVWVDIEPRGRSYTIKASEYPRLDREYEAAIQKKFGSVPSSAPRAAREQTQQTPAPAALGNGGVIPFDYAVKSAKVKTFASGKGMVLILHNPKTTKSVTAYLYGEHPELAEGVCLRQVQLSHHDGPTPFNTLDSFQVAA